MFKRIANIARKWTQGRPDVGTTPSDVVFRENKISLIRYRSDSVQGAPILLVPSLINRHYVLDLMHEKSFVEYLVGRGHDVYMIDWGRPGPEDRYLTFDTYCDRYLGRMIRQVARRSPSGKTHLLGYCLGGTMAAIRLADRQEDVQSFVALAAPVDFEDAGVLGVFSRAETIDLNAMARAFGNIPWPLMQAGFHLVRPTMNLSKAIYMLDRAWDDQFLDGFFALETWSNDNVSFPGRAFERYIQALYRENQLIRDEFALSGRRISLSDIRVPTLTVCFEHDHIVPAKSASILHDVIASKERELKVLRGGHVGAVVSRRASQSLWPMLSDWYRERDSTASDVLAVS